MSFLTDLTFSPEEQPSRIDFNKRFETLNPLIWYWWKRRIATYVLSMPAKQLSNTTFGTGAILYYSKTVVPAKFGSTSLVMENPQTINVGSGASAADALRFLKEGYYFGHDAGHPYYFADSSVSDPYWSVSPVYAYIYCYDVSSFTAEWTIGDWEYLQSPNRDAYPDSGVSDGYEYQFLGKPLDNAATAPKIAAGEYTGTGTYGSANPNTLTFDFEPKLVVISDGISFCYFQLGLESALCMYDNGGSVGCRSEHVSFLGHSMTWYNTGNAGFQLNDSNRRYKYIALG